MSNMFLQQVKAFRRSLTPAARKKDVKIKSAIYPSAKERAYAKQISSWLLPIKEFVESYLARNGNSILRGDGIKSLNYNLLSKIDAAIEAEEIPDRKLIDEVHNILSIFHTDAIPGDSFDEMQSQLDQWMNEYYPEEKDEIKTSEIMAGVAGAAAVIYASQSKMFAQQAAAVVGFDYYENDVWWSNMRDQWMAENYRLIKSLSTEYITKVNFLTEKAILDGITYAELTKQIRVLSESITKKRARLIARDQIGKLQGLIAHKQQLEAGVDTYNWQTAGDERVRGNPLGRFPNAVPSHWIMQGKLCRWDDSSVYSNDGGKTWIPRTGKMPLSHPGMAIQCRCSAIPNFDTIIKKADKMIQEAA